MPKLDGTHVAARLKRRIVELLCGNEVAVRDIRALLNSRQLSIMDAAWAEQQILRKQKRARNKADELRLGWKSKREIYFEALDAAYDAAIQAEDVAWEKRQADAQARQARIYLAELHKHLSAGVDKAVAEARANNALTRTGLRRVDGLSRQTTGLTKRDIEVRAMEQAILRGAVLIDVASTEPRQQGPSIGKVSASKSQS